MTVTDTAHVAQINAHGRHIERGVRAAGPPAGLELARAGAGQQPAA
jgi:hypothetical protein